MRTLRIYLYIAVHHDLLLLIWSSSIAAATVLGILIPNLCVRVHYFNLTLAMIRFFFLITCGIHQAKAGSSAIRRCIENSAKLTG